MQGLRSKRILITGGASGIGKATAERFCSEGSRVAILDRDGDACSRMENEVPEVEFCVTADAGVQDEVNRTFDTIDEKFGGLDVLINNAGISIRHPFLDVTFDEWRRVVETNLNGVFLVAQQAAKRMKAQGDGVILNTGSTNGLTGYPYYADYNATKAGVIELTRSMALELAPDIRVNVVCPGYIITPMQEAEYTPEMLEAVNRKLPMGRHGKPEEVAALFAYLASDEAAYITGQTFIIDGGEIAGGLASR
jgi:NAD(P)-dependent dehydrogenase (short-subunit alcohol dehydrogenase family)